MRANSIQLAKCLEYALSHSVEDLRIRNGEFYPTESGYPCLNSAVIKTLHLINCRGIVPSDKWTLPALTSLHLEDVYVVQQILRFENLKDLTLAGNSVGSFSFTIDCPNLKILTLAPNFRHKVVVSAPNLLCFKYWSQHVPEGFSAGDGFPCIKEVDIDFHIKDNIVRCYNDKMRNNAMKNLATILNAVRETPFLRLTIETIQVLQQFLVFAVHHQPSPSPFGNLKFLHLHCRGPYIEPTSSDNKLITSYLLGNSPSAQIIKGNKKSENPSTYEKKG
ncbi:uncharacterized protein LOC141685819 [Apium graveolens]|uniref:uncharacterized protein LOC141685819 n=1 Tax=Apium graveolens TaxID=4045 RepID=UPI003D78EED5